MDSSEIDFSKENIQPLKEGRLTSYLGTALNVQCKGKPQNDLMLEREKFELEIRKYKGDDPLEVWYNYICWVIQSYPNNESGHCTTLLRNCLATFKDDERYHQDVRYVKLWIKYIQTQNDPLETFEMVHKHGIGNLCTEFYKSWADEFEAAGDFKSASAVYAKGYSCGAQPAAELSCHQRNFEDRVARRLATRTDDDDDIVSSAGGDEKRRVLSALAMTTEGGRNKKHGTVGSVRTGPAIIGSAGVLKTSNHSHQQQKPVQFQIFSDQRSDESRGRVKLEKIPSAAVTNRENTMKPGKWTRGHGSSSKRPAATSATIPFRVHEDHLSGQGIATPGGASYSENVFKVRKVEKDDYDCPLAIFEPADPTKIPMYCKDKVYSGGMEFSIEELRAIKYFEAENKKLKEAKEKEICDKKAHVESKEMNNACSMKTPQSSSEKVPQMEWSSSQVSPNDNFVTPKVVDWHGMREQDLREGGRASSIRQLDFMSAPSPTINTRAANAMMNELFSATFSSDSMLVMPQNTLPKTPKFEIPYDEGTVFLNVSEERAFAQPVEERPKFSIHCDENAPENRAFSQPIKERPKFSIHCDENSSENRAFAQPFEDGPKFSIHCDENAPEHRAFSQPIEARPKFSIHCDENSSENRAFAQPFEDGPKFSIHFDENAPENRLLAQPIEERPKYDDEFSVKDENWGAKIPFVPPPKVEEEVDEEDNTKENQCPDEYSQTSNKDKRPLAGVLVPSKNIPFQPLEELEEESEPDQIKMEKEMDRDGSSSFAAPLDFSFERELLSALNDESEFDVPMKRKVTLNEDIETNIFGTNAIGGSYFKHLHTISSVKTEVQQNPKPTNDWTTRELKKEHVTNCLPNSSNSAKISIKDGNVWSSSISACQSNVENASDPVEIVENPTDYGFIENLMYKVAVPVTRSQNFHRIAQIIPEIKTNEELNLREGLKLRILKVISNSVDRKVFLALKSDGNPVVIKCELVSCEWEFYISREIRNRLDSTRMHSAFASIREGYLFNGDKSILLMEYVPNGTFLDLLNLYRRKHLIFPEVLVLYFTIDMINTVRHFHRCKILHGAFRPDSLLIGEIPSTPTVWNGECFNSLLPVLQLTNFGKCVDLTLFTENVQFKSSPPSHDPYQCLEMQNGRLWTYQADLYSIAFTVHFMIFGEFMEVSRVNNVCCIKKKIPIQFKSSIWDTLFNTLLNVPSCDNIPDLLAIQNKFQGLFLSYKLEEFASALGTMRTILDERKKWESEAVRRACFK